MAHRFSVPVAAVALTMVFGAGAGEASAQNDGLHVDPDSPAGKEYALPLDSAREETAGGPATADETGDEAPLFGTGISEKPAGREGRRRSPDAGERQAEPEGAAAGPEEGSDGRRAAAAVAQAAGNGPPTGLVTALVALAVLVGGGVVALLLRSLGAGRHG